MLFSVPITGKETIVDTPLNCKSIRSIHFFDRYGYTRKMGQFMGSLDDVFRGSVSISIDGKMICDHLWILPFMDHQEESHVAVSRDWRRIAIPCLKNTEMSEIKIETNNPCLDCEVVFEYSDVEVEREHFYHIESYPFSIYSQGETDGTDIQPFSFNEISLGEEFQIQTHEEADMIFVYQNIVDYYINPNTLFSKESYRYEYATRYYHTHNEYPSAYPIPQFKLTISDMNDAMPSKMPVDLISVDVNITWKEAVYRLNEGLSKHPKFTFDGKLPVGANNTTIATIYLIHDCNF